MRSRQPVLGRKPCPHTRHRGPAQQMFPSLEPAEIGRLHKFGEIEILRAGMRILATGEIAPPGPSSILTGAVDVVQSTGLDTPAHRDAWSGIVHGRARPAVRQSGPVDAHAKGAVATLVIPSHRLRNLLVEEAELGERIMRAWILRRVGLLETGAGCPVIVGDAENGDVLRLEGFLARNGHPHLRFGPENRPMCQDAH